MRKKWIWVLTASILMFCLAFASCGQDRENFDSGNNSEIDGGNLQNPDTDHKNPSSEDKETPPAEKDEQEDEMIHEIFLLINDQKICVKLEQNAAVDALIQLLKQGDLTYTASDYGGFEKVGDLGATLPRNDKQMTAETGDIMLYLGDKIVLFYGSNSWSYTKLGHVQVSSEEWKNILTKSDQITVKITLK